MCYQALSDVFRWIACISLVLQVGKVYHQAAGFFKVFWSIVRPDFEFLKYTPYLTLVDELWNVYCEYFGEDQLRYSTVIKAASRCIFRWIACDHFSLLRVGKVSPSLLVSSLLSGGIILYMGSANERWRYNVTSSLIGWAHTQNDSCLSTGLTRVLCLTCTYLPAGPNQGDPIRSGKAISHLHTLRDFLNSLWPVGLFDIKTIHYQYRNSHYKDETIVNRYNGIPYSGKMISLYWFSPMVMPYGDIDFGPWKSAIRTPKLLWVHLSISQHWFR